MSFYRLNNIVLPMKTLYIIKTWMIIVVNFVCKGSSPSGRSNYLKQGGCVTNWFRRNNIQWNLYQMQAFFYQKILENIACKVRLHWFMHNLERWRTINNDLLYELFDLYHIEWNEYICIQPNKHMLTTYVNAHELLHTISTLLGESVCYSILPLCPRIMEIG